MTVLVRCHRPVVTVLSLAALACFLPLAVSATTVEVVPGSGAPACVSGYPTYPTISAAVTAVHTIPGAFIKVCPGTYAEQVNITSKLTLEGVQGTAAGSNPSYAAIIVPPAGGMVQNGVDITGFPTAAQIFVNAGGSNTVTIEHLTVDAIGNNVGNGGNNGSGCALNVVGIYYQNTPGTISYNTVRNQYQTDFTGANNLSGCQNGLAINVESSTSSPAVTISYNSVRAYQKNGITASGDASTSAFGPAATIKYNYVVGLGASALNWDGLYTGNSVPAGSNGIQVGFGATGTVEDNTVDDNIWADGALYGPAASGILVFASNGITVSSNYVNSAQYGIAIATDSYGLCGGSSCGTADGASVKLNKVTGTQLADAIDLCSNGNTATSNNLYGSSQSAIHFDDTCTNAGLGTVSGNNNTATGNTINEACAGILLGTGNGNAFTPNTYYTVENSTLAGDTCTPTPGARAGKHQTMRPVPYNPSHR
jgi:hypothetical protein